MRLMRKSRIIGTVISPRRTSEPKCSRRILTFDPYVRGSLRAGSWRRRNSTLKAFRVGPRSVAGATSGSADLISPRSFAASTRVGTHFLIRFPSRVGGTLSSTIHPPRDRVIDIGHLDPNLAL